MASDTSVLDTPLPDRPRMLVTGASGLLGANFVVAASQRFQISAAYARHRVTWTKVDSFRADLRRKDETAALLERTRPAIITHFAAITNVDYCEEHPDEAKEVNAGITERLAKWAAANRARFLLMSTDSIFDGRHGGYTENDEPHPLNRYGGTKLEAEHLVQAFVPNHLILRANIFGWNAQPKNSLAEWILARLEAGQQVPGFTDTVFAPLLVNTLADIMLTMVARGACGTYHVASGDALSKYEFALALAERFGFPGHLVTPTLMATILKAPRPGNTALDASKLRRELGITSPSVHEDLQRFKQLRDDGFVARLKAAYSAPP